jgi:lactate dehydrogenase-like 2-hydroxyacid dehydrogenase
MFLDDHEIFFYIHCITCSNYFDQSSHDIAEILLMLALNTNQSINQSINQSTNHQTLLLSNIATSPNPDHVLVFHTIDRH